MRVLRIRAYLSPHRAARRRAAPKIRVRRGGGDVSTKRRKTQPRECYFNHRATKKKSHSENIYFLYRSKRRVQSWKRASCDRDVSSETFDLTATKLNNKYFVSLSLESIEQYFDECNRKVLNLNSYHIKLLSLKYLNRVTWVSTCNYFVLFFYSDQIGNI